MVYLLKMMIFHSSPGQELVEELAADHEETALGRLPSAEGHVLLRQGANAQRHAGEPPGESKGIGESMVNILIYGYIWILYG